MFFNPTGSWLYHLHALKAQPRSVWSGFQTWVESCLRDWQGDLGSERLMIWGPSAGHCLPWNWLASIGPRGQLLIVEPDAMSRRWFAMRLRLRCPMVKVSWVHHLAPDLPLVQSSPDRLQLWSESVRNLGPTLILFANCLGQLPLVHSAPSQEHLSVGANPHWRPDNQNLFLTELSAFRWASFHDLASIEHQPSWRPRRSSGEFESHQPEAPLVNQLAQALELRDLEILDHETSWLHTNQGRVPWCHWPLTKRQSHFIAWTSHCPLAPGDS